MSTKAELRKKGRGKAEEEKRGRMDCSEVGTRRGKS
jgi:hypothetical protein